MIRKRKQSSLDAEKRFLAALAIKEYTSLEPAWLGTHKPHRIKCANGHEFRACPQDIWRNRRNCGLCTNRTKTIFYIVALPNLEFVKFGVTNPNSESRRLQDHKADKLSRVVRLFCYHAAYELEQRIIKTLVSLEIMPEVGKEYYAGSALPWILDIVDRETQ